MRYRIGVSEPEEEIGGPVGPLCFRRNPGVWKPLLARRRARVLKEEMQEGSPLFTVHAYVPVAESFGFADELRRWTSGASSALLVLSHWEALAEDPCFTARMTTKSDSTATASGGCAAAVAEEEEDEDELTPPRYGGFALARFSRITVYTQISSRKTSSRDFGTDT
ncbi:hypothetical protein HYC85_011013 [Camellia sinensis]|uniref:Elongation factor EFG domain-containing protein n=1 Tax=Camellia sinensis TaxID=4442 RepID=A0A7J7HK29_CAMSI|nr:hypothetical protein HYC85_011013 [Camellia sinensis]